MVQMFDNLDHVLLSLQTFSQKNTQISDILIRILISLRSLQTYMFSCSHNVQ